MTKFPITILASAVLSGFCFLTLAGCNQGNSPASPEDKPGRNGLTHQVAVVSYPLQFLTQRIAGESIEVLMLVPPNENPQDWQPGRDAIVQMQSADLIFANGTGATYANWMAVVSLPDSKVRDTASKGLALADYIAVEDVSVVHSHGPEGEHSHPTMVARTWLDPAMAKKQATYIAAELKKTYPDNSDAIDRNLEQLVNALDPLSESLRSAAEGEKILLTATPNLKFLTRATGINDRHLTWFETPDLETAEADLNRVLGSDWMDRPGVILFDNQLPGDELIQFLKSKNLEPIALNLIDHAPAAGDFLTELKKNIDSLGAALKSE